MKNLQLAYNICCDKVLMTWATDMILLEAWLEPFQSLPNPAIKYIQIDFLNLQLF